MTRWRTSRVAPAGGVGGSWATSRRSRAPAAPTPAGPRKRRTAGGGPVPGRPWRLKAPSRGRAHAPVLAPLAVAPRAQPLRPASSANPGRPGFDLSRRSVSGGPDAPPVPAEGRPRASLGRTPFAPRMSLVREGRPAGQAGKGGEARFSHLAFDAHLSRKARGCPQAPPPGSDAPTLIPAGSPSLPR